uniref:Uncharacterized protein n=1 Tax=Arundo donax TaxID=35708 RepID=A0A0A8ZGH4_ARUDO
MSSSTHLSFLWLFEPSVRK